MTYRDVWPFIALLLTGPICAVMYILFAFGFWVGLKLPEGPIQTTWKYLYGAPFTVLNFLFNVTVGSFIWFERPRFLQFTTRLKDKKKEGYKLAYFLCGMLNIFDPNHC